MLEEQATVGVVNEDAILRTEREQADAGFLHELAITAYARLSEVISAPATSVASPASR